MVNSPTAVMAIVWIGASIVVAAAIPAQPTIRDFDLANRGRSELSHCERESRTVQPLDAGDRNRQGELAGASSRRVAFGDLTRDGKEDALVLIECDHHPPHHLLSPTRDLLLYTLADQGPVLLTRVSEALRAGGRLLSGSLCELRDYWVEGGLLNIERACSPPSLGSPPFCPDCGGSLQVTKYRWISGLLMQVGLPQAIGGNPRGSVESN